MPPLSDQQASVRGQAKPIFAKPVRAFANRVAALPGLPLYPASAVAAALLAALAGAFGTGALPFGQRLAFWLLLIGFHTMLWICWFAWRVRRPSDWWTAVGIGAIAVNLPIPLEIAAALKLVGVRAVVGWQLGWLYSAGVSAAILLLIMTALFETRRRFPSAARKGRLWRAGFRDLQQVAAIAAEDHYCRVWHAGGASRLIHGRFSDLTAELAAVDGLTVRRGQWVAASAVGSIERTGRSWSLVLADGRAVRVASSTTAELRRRGWLASGGAAPPPTANGALQSPQAVAKQ